MKAIKFFSTFFICLGCIIAFVGVAVMVLPMINNEQLSLVLSSFQMPSQNVIVNAMNSAMTFALANCYGVLFAGIGMIVVGVLLHLNAASQSAAPSAAQRWERAAAPRQPEAEAFAIPKWRSSKAAEVNQPNPFANAKVAAAGGGTPYRRMIDDEPPAAINLNTFAPAVESTAAAGRAQPSFVRSRPVATAVPGASPYARPAAVTTHEEHFQPVYTEKPAAGGMEPPQATAVAETTETAAFYQPPVQVVPAAQSVPSPQPTPIAQPTPPPPAIPSAQPAPWTATPAVADLAVPPAPEPLKFVNPASVPPAHQRKPLVVRSGFTHAAASEPPTLATTLEAPAAVIPPAVFTAVSEPTAVTAAPSAATPAAMAAPTPVKPAKAAKPRIKSTMGKHS